MTSRIPLRSKEYKCVPIASIKFYKLRIDVSRLFQPSLSCMVLPEAESGPISGRTLTTLPLARVV